MIHAQVEAGDLGGMGNEFEGVDPCVLRGRLGEKQVLQLNVDRVEWNVDLVSRERLIGCGVEDADPAAARHTSAVDEERTEVSAPFGGRRLCAVHRIGLGKMKALVAGEEEGAIPAIVKMGNVDWTVKVAAVLIALVGWAAGRRGARTVVP